MSVESDTLGRIDQGDKDHERDLADVKALWEREDAVTKANRAKVLAAYDQGAKDRAEARKRAKEAAEPPINQKFTRAEIARLQALLDAEDARKEPVATPLGQRETADVLQREREDRADAEEEAPAATLRPEMARHTDPATHAPIAESNPNPRMSSLPAVSWSTPEESNRPDPTNPVVVTRTSGVGEEARPLDKTPTLPVLPPTHIS